LEPRCRGDIGFGKRAKSRREEDCGVEEKGFIRARPCKEIRYDWFELRVGGFAMRRTRAAVPHSARVEVALLSGGKRSTTVTMRKAPE